MSFLRLFSSSAPSWIQHANSTDLCNSSPSSKLVLATGPLHRLFPLSEPWLRCHHSCPSSLAANFQRGHIVEGTRRRQVGRREKLDISSSSFHFRIWQELSSTAWLTTGVFSYTGYLHSSGFAPSVLGMLIAPGACFSVSDPHLSSFVPFIPLPS